jgi:hypothetical protein
MLGVLRSWIFNYGQARQGCMELDEHLILHFPDGVNLASDHAYAVAKLNTSARPTELVCQQIAL